LAVEIDSDCNLMRYDDELFSGNILVGAMLNDCHTATDQQYLTV
jgi:hypothetical protein